jgi:hypothetical protein
MLWNPSFDPILAAALGAWIVNEFNPESVLDFGGANNALYLAPYEAAGATVTGIDLTNNPDFTPFCQPSDLWYDLAMCVGVAPELQLQYATPLINSLSSMGRRILLFLGSSEGLSANGKPQPSWLPRFRANGWDEYPPEGDLRLMLSALWTANGMTVTPSTFSNTFLLQKVN